MVLCGASKFGDIIGLTGKFVQYEKVQVCFKFQVLKQENV